MDFKNDISGGKDSNSLAKDDARDMLRQAGRRAVTADAIQNDPTVLNNKRPHNLDRAARRDAVPCGDTMTVWSF